MIEERGIGMIVETIENEFGGWPLLKNEQPDLESSSNISIIEKIIKLRKVGSSLPFELYVALNPKDPKQNILRVRFFLFIDYFLWFL